MIYITTISGEKNDLNNNAATVELDTIQAPIEVTKGTNGGIYTTV